MTDELHITATTATRGAWWRRVPSWGWTTGAAAVALAVGGLLGWGLTSAALSPGIGRQASEISAVTAERDAALEDARKERSGRLAAERTAEQLVTEKSAWETELQGREDAVAARESAVQTTEEQIAANSFGSGVRVVGVDIAAGVYRTEGSGTCYYAWKTGTGADAGIIDNNLIEGPATVTLNDGDVFESSRCGTWTKQG